MADTDALPELPDDNPFSRPSELPYRLPPFDRITDDHFRPAFDRGMAAHRAEVAAIASDPAPPTFDNTVVALERAGALLDRVVRAFNAVTAADTNPERQRLEQELAPELAAHWDAIFLDTRLYQRVRALYEAREELDLDPESARLLERYHIRFVRAGAALSAADQERLRELNQELSGLMADFKARLLADTNALAVTVDDPGRLAGLADTAVAAAAEAGRERGTGGHVLTLILPTGQPALAELHDRSVRERLYAAARTRGCRGNEYDTRELVLAMVRKRAERAKLLGFPHHAGYQIADRAAGSLEAVDEVLAKLVPPAVANADAEAAELQAAIDREGGGFALQPWDWAYYAERVRTERYDVDTAALRPYLELSRVLVDGVFHAAGELYGVRFVERHDLPAYHSEVRAFEVFNDSGAPVGLFLGDFFTRDSKRGGAWQYTLVEQSRLTGSRPVAVVNMNISRPAAGEPALLTVDEVKTLFHEFGHALHNLFSDCRYPTLAGTSVPRDVVEFPSQVNEMWMLWPEVVSHYAVHHRTGEPLPAGLAERLREARKFNAGYALTEYLASTLLDMAWHRLSPEEAAAVDDVERFEADALAAAGVAVPAVPPRYRSTYFAHIFTTDSYSAGYYSYVWSEISDADLVEWFTEHGGLRRENGDRFRAGLLSRGNTVDPREAFRAVRGRDPELAPLLARRGLTG